MSVIEELSTQDEEVAEWPKLTAMVHTDTTASVTEYGIEHACEAESIEALRAGIIARCTDLARKLHRPVRLGITEGPIAWLVAVRPTGIVQTLTNGRIAPAEDLLPISGPCRTCQATVLVTADTCAQCGRRAPLDVSQAPASAEITFAQRQSEIVDENTTQRLSPRPRALTLIVDGHLVRTTHHALSIGRNPDPIDGRERVVLRSPQLIVIGHRRLGRSLFMKPQVLTAQNSRPKLSPAQNYS